MPITTEAIGLVGVSKTYPGVQALDNISFSVSAGSIHGFLGPNGAGKSTTMNIITGLLRESSGSIRLMGKECSPSERKRLIGYLPEQPPVYPQMIVRDYLQFVCSLHSKKGTDAKTSIERAVSSCGLDSVLNRMIGNLSKGFRQRVGIAQALILGAEILILDEPTVGLDPVSVAEIRELILGLRGKHTVLLSSHLLHEISLVCEDITMINHGKVVASGTQAEIQTRFVSGARYILKADRLDQNLQSQLDSKFSITTIEKEHNWILNAKEKVAASEVLRFLVESDAKVSEFYQEKVELEDIFKSAMKEGTQL
tara:strand:+ start:8577 stop:9509 length:933 start_codon:yes stop_codon:yes gene_type:complete